MFERAARRLKPTAQALALAEPAARMLAAARACALVTAGASQQLAGSVRLTASEVVAAHVLPPLLAPLATQHPEIQIELVASDRLDNLLEREADIAVRMLRPTQGALITRHLADWPLGFYAHRDALAAPALRAALATPGAARSVETLAAARWIGQDQSLQLIKGFRARGVDIDGRFFGWRCDNPLVNFEALRAGLGVGIAIVPLAARHPELVRVLPDIALPVLPVWLTAHRELRASQRLRLVFDFLASALAAWAAGAPPMPTQPRASSTKSKAARHRKLAG